MVDGVRRLAAIVVGDVTGYSRMMAEDGEGTLSTLRAHLNAIDPVVLNHGGRVVKTTGDGLLIEMPSAVAAVEAAVEVQDLMSTRNRELPESRTMQFRFGINLGDVVVDDSGDVFGHGVNVAARVESVADPGGVAVTDAVFEAVRGRVDFSFIDDGWHELKNVPRPMRIWKITTESGVDRRTQDRSSRRTLATVAVLPFENMSGDAEQEYFADGITEDLLTALAHETHLAVVARNSTFAYKGGAADVRTIARELDASHVVQGSVRKAGNRIRVTAQLIDAETGHHVWAERYDRELADVFELQDELVAAIYGKLRPTFWQTAAEQRSVADKSFDAWDLTIQGQFEVNKQTNEGRLKAIDLFDRARQIDPRLVGSVTGTAEAWLYLAVAGWRESDVNPWERGFAAAEEAFRLDPNDYRALAAISAARTISGRPDEGIQYARRMIELNPHAANGYHWLGLGLAASGQPDASISPYTQAWRLGRHEPSRYDTANDLAYVHYLVGNYEAAITWGQRSLELHNDYLQAHVVLAAAHAQLAGSTEGGRHVDAILATRPDFSTSKFHSRLVYTRQEDRDHIVDGLLKAGLPQ